MRPTRTPRKLLIATGCIGVLIVAVVLAAPSLMHRFLIQTLDSRGVTARIGDVDVNLFTGHIAVENARGHNSAGYGFTVEQLDVWLDYWPLINSTIRFSNAHVQNAALDIRRRANNSLGVGGVTVLAPPKHRAGQGWQTGFEALHADNLQVTYSHASSAGGDAFQQSATFQESSVRNLLFFSHSRPIKLDVKLTSGQSWIAIDGTIHAFSDPIESDVRFKTHRLALGDLGYFLENTGFERVAGRVTSNLHVQIKHQSGQALTIKATGSIRYHEPRAVHRNGLHIKADSFRWNGRFNVALLRPGGKPTRITSRGMLKTRSLTINYPQAFRLATRTGTWQGKTKLTLAESQDILSANGKVTGHKSELRVPHIFKMDLTTFHWHGEAGMRITNVVSRHARGQFRATNARLDLLYAPLGFRADKARFDGRYAQRPANDKDYLPVSLNGRLSTRTLIVVDQSLQAYWAAAKTAEFHQLVVDSVDNVSIKRAKFTNLRLFQRPEFPIKKPGYHATVLIDQVDAKGFELEDQRHYRLDTLHLRGADFRLLRDPNGNMPAVRFFGDHSPGTPAAENTTRPPSTVTIDKLRISGESSFHFRDASVEPGVRLAGHELRFTLGNIDTTTPHQPFHFKIRTELKRTGELRAPGQVAPLASNGPNARATIRIRSLQLPPLSGYMNALLGHGITSGVLNANIYPRAQNGNLDGKAHLWVSNFHLGPGTSTKARQRLGLPLQAVINLLRTDNGVIEISMALQGDLTSPSFSVMSLVQEAILAGLHDALMSVASPIGWLSRIADALSDIGDSITLKSITFQANTAQFTTSALQYLAQVKMVLKTHAGLILRLHPSSGGNTALAQRRMREVREYLMARQIDPGRIERGSPIPIKPTQLGLSIMRIGGD